MKQSAQAKFLGDIGFNVNARKASRQVPFWIAEAEAWMNKHQPTQNPIDMWLPVSEDWGDKAVWVGMKLEDFEVNM